MADAELPGRTVGVAAAGVVRAVAPGDWPVRDAASVRLAAVRRRALGVCRARRRHAGLVAGSRRCGLHALGVVRAMVDGNLRRALRVLARVAGGPPVRGGRVVRARFGGVLSAVRRAGPRPDLSPAGCDRRGQEDADDRELVHDPPLSNRRAGHAVAQDPGFVGSRCAKMSRERAPATGAPSSVWALCRESRHVYEPRPRPKAIPYAVERSIAASARRLSRSRPIVTTATVLPLRSKDTRQSRPATLPATSVRSHVSAWPTYEMPTS